MRWRPLVADGPSLGTRLSRWLALQGLIAAFAVSGAVYAVNLWVLQSRQHEELALKSAVVRHALAETAGSSAAEELQHKLKDFLAGHEDMTLSITSSDGEFSSALRRRPRGAMPLRPAGSCRWRGKAHGLRVLPVASGWSWGSM